MQTRSGRARFANRSFHLTTRRKLRPWLQEKAGERLSSHRLGYCATGTSATALAALPEPCFAFFFPEQARYATAAAPALSSTVVPSSA